jgi:hypothetical protein
MQPLYLSRTEDLGHGDLVKVDCATAGVNARQSLDRAALAQITSSIA